jgi:hypothetical protein
MIVAAVVIITTGINDQRQCRHHEGEPIDPDRATPEMAHVGIEGFSAREREKDRAQNNERGPGIGVQQIRHGITRIESPQDCRESEDVRYAGDSEKAKPEHHHRAEEATDLAAAVALERKQCKQDRCCNRHDVGLEQRSHDVHPLDRAQDRNCRCYHRLTEEQGRARKSDYEHQTSIPSRCRKGERKQRHRAPFPLIVGPHHDHHVLDADDEGDGPERQREHPEDRRLRFCARGCFQRLAKSVNRTCADIPEDDAESPDHQSGPRRLLGGGRR